MSYAAAHTRCSTSRGESAHARPCAGGTDPASAQCAQIISSELLAFVRIFQTVLERFALSLTAEGLRFRRGRRAARGSEGLARCGRGGRYRPPCLPPTSIQPLHKSTTSTSPPRSRIATPPNHRLSHSRPHLHHVSELSPPWTGYLHSAFADSPPSLLLLLALLVSLQARQAKMPVQDSRPPARVDFSVITAACASR